MSLMLVAVGWHCRYRIVAALVVLPLPPPHPGRSCAANAAAGADAHVFVFCFSCHVSRPLPLNGSAIPMCLTADIGGCGSLPSDCYI